MPVLNVQGLIADRISAIQVFHNSVGTQKAEIDVSGGVDSAVILGLLAKALGPQNVTAVYQGINSSPESLERAQEVSKVFGVSLIAIDLTPIYQDLVGKMITAFELAQPEPSKASHDLNARRNADPTILGSIRSTLRAPVGRGFNRLAGGGIRHGTGNECEDRWTRFYQKGGDGEVDTNPIAMLSKGEVYQLALALGVPKSIISAAPTPDLWGVGEVHNDEAEFDSYFGFKASDYGQTFYSYIDVETGEYTKVGLIERVSRFLDRGWVFGGDLFFGSELFSSDSQLVLAASAQSARKAGEPFHGLLDELVGRLLRMARKIEASTRHKMNPNIPALGCREALVAEGILTNNLPVVSP